LICPVIGPVGLVRSIPDGVIPESEVTYMAKTVSRGIELEPIDRLEEKVKLLVGMIERLKAEQTRAAEENQRLAREVEGLHARLAMSDGLASEVSMLKEERDIIRTRVGEMLEQLEALSL
jgi:FtsZ-binding cell division protein ZapB